MPAGPGLAYDPNGSCADRGAATRNRANTNGTHYQNMGDPNDYAILLRCLPNDVAQPPTPFYSYQIIFNTRNDWTFDAVPGPSSPGDGPDVWGLATHEFGHATGFVGHWDWNLPGTRPVWHHDDASLCDVNDIDLHTMCSGSVEASRLHRLRGIETHDWSVFTTQYPTASSSCPNSTSSSATSDDSSFFMPHCDIEGEVGQPTVMSSSGGTVIYSSLTSGNTYRVTVGGFIDYTNYKRDALGNPQRLSDAECAINREEVVDGEKWLAYRWFATFGDDRLDVVSDTGDPSAKTFYSWTPNTPYAAGSLNGEVGCSSDHFYTTTFVASSDPTRFYLWDGVYDDNTGTLTIEVEET